ncbi:MAG: hypothetical protein ACI90V_008254 [Bacillariaceae sp.]|jgi:hypothetical protein
MKTGEQQYNYCSTDLSGNDNDESTSNAFDSSSTLLIGNIAITEPAEIKMPNNPHREWRPILITFWIFHFAASILIIAWTGLSQSGEDHKYIPADVNALIGEDGNKGSSQCRKAYVDVYASSIDELICCMSANDDDDDDDDGICRSMPWYLYLVKRLARFPEAILIPLFPLLVRGIYYLVTQCQQRRGVVVASSSDSVEFKRQQEINTLTRRRFFLYIGLTQIRWWVLHLLFGAIEYQIVVHVAGGGDDDNGCWYDSLLRGGNHNSCKGKAFDYSDHIVLYWAQILPIVFTETLFSFVAPFWRTTTTATATTTKLLKTVRLVPTILIIGVIYIYIISFVGTYNTVAYYHTFPEVIVGYLISLLIQIPLFLIQCTSLMENVRDYFFGRGIMQSS